MSDGAQQHPTTPVVSVIVPFYDSEAFLGHSVASLRRQTLSDIEILLVNDGSGEASTTLARSLANADHRIRVLHQDHIGPGAARNRGLDTARGEFVAFVDSDDEATPDMCAALARRARETQADIVVGRPQDWPGSPLPLRLVPNPVGAVRALLLGKMSMGVYGKLYRRTFLQAHRISFPPCAYIEDRHFLIQCLARAPRLVGLDNVVYARRDRPDSTMRLVTEKHMADATAVLRLDTQFLERCGLLPECGYYVAFATLRVDLFLFRRLAGPSLRPRLRASLREQRALFATLPGSPWLRRTVWTAARAMEWELAIGMGKPVVSATAIRILGRALR